MGDTLSMHPDTYETRANAVRARLDAQIPHNLRLSGALLDSLPVDVTGIQAECGVLSPEELAITDLDATTVVQRIAAGKLTAVEAVTAFGKRAAIAQQLVGCLTDFFLDEGIVRARELDRYFKREGKTVGPLHGLPISIKDHIPIKGRWGSAGFLSNVGISEHDCDMTNILRELGAVFYVKTNQPQTIMHLETHSVYGRTLNPFNRNLTSGGSSGGEAALIALRGSCIGVGTDIGGSIRNPSANCGIYGFKPTAGLLPMYGYHEYENGEGCAASTGPMCRSLSDMHVFVNAVLGAHPSLRNPELVPMTWSVPFPLGVWDKRTKLRVGIIEHDGVVTPHPPMLRAIRMARDKLAQSPEVKLVEFTPYKHGEGYNIVREMYFEDGGETVRRLLAEAGEPMFPLTEWVLSSPTQDHDAASLWALHRKRDAFRRAYLEHWNASGVDVVLAPPFQGSANPHDTAKYWGYTAIWNILDYPGIVFPSGVRVDPELDPRSLLELGRPPLNEMDEYNRSLYDPELMQGAPINLQIVGRRFDDCKLLSAHELVERIIRG